MKDIKQEDWNEYIKPRYSQSDLDNTRKTDFRSKLVMALFIGFWIGVIACAIAFH